MGEEAIHIRRGHGGGGYPYKERSWGEEAIHIRMVRMLSI